jgi:hypothetical protein
MTTLYAAGYNPDTLILTPVASEAIDVMVSGITGARRRPLRGLRPAGHEDGGALVMARYGHPSEDAARERLLGAFGFNGAGIGSAAGSAEAGEPHG